MQHQRQRGYPPRYYSRETQKVIYRNDIPPNQIYNQRSPPRRVFYQEDMHRQSPNRHFQQEQTHRNYRQEFQSPHRSPNMRNRRNSPQQYRSPQNNRHLIQETDYTHNMGFEEPLYEEPRIVRYTGKNIDPTQEMMQELENNNKKTINECEPIKPGTQPKKTGAQGLYDHLEVEKSMGVSPAPEIITNDQNQNQNKNNINNNKDKNKEKNNENNSKPKRIHLLPIENDNHSVVSPMRKQNKVLINSSYHVNKEKTSLAHRPLPLPPGVYYNNQNLTTTKISNIKIQRQYDPRDQHYENLQNQYRKQEAYQKATKQSIEQYYQQQQIQQAALHLQRGGTSLAYDVSNGRHINGSPQKKKNKKKKNKNNRQQQQQQQQQVQQAPNVIQTVDYNIYNQNNVRNYYNNQPKGYYSQDGLWIPAHQLDGYSYEKFVKYYQTQLVKGSSKIKKQNTESTNIIQIKNDNGRSLKRRIRDQVEHYFSDINLKTDKFLRALMNEEGYVRASDIISFPRLLKMKVTSDNILDACKTSKIVETKGRYLRKHSNWKLYLPDLTDTSQQTLQAIATKIANSTKRYKNSQKLKEKEKQKEIEKNKKKSNNNIKKEPNPYTKKNYKKRDDTKEQESTPTKTKKKENTQDTTPNTSTTTTNTNTNTNTTEESSNNTAPILVSSNTSSPVKISPIKKIITTPDKHSDTKTNTSGSPVSTTSGGSESMILID